jgi:hypothetical protein
MVRSASESSKIRATAPTWVSDVTYLSVGSRWWYRRRPDRYSWRVLAEARIGSNSLHAEPSRQRSVDAAQKLD